MCWSFAEVRSKTLHIPEGSLFEHRLWSLLTSFMKKIIRISLCIYILVATMIRFSFFLKYRAFVETSLFIQSTFVCSYVFVCLGILDS